MPVHKAQSNSKKDLNKAVSANIHELAKDPKERSQKQIIAIAYSEARSKKKNPAKSKKG
jgi:hypothetical protein